MTIELARLIRCPSCGHSPNIHTGPGARAVFKPGFCHECMSWCGFTPKDDGNYRVRRLRRRRS